MKSSGVGGGGAEVASQSQKFWLAESLGKSPENPGKNSAQRCLTSKNGAQGLHKHTWRPFLGGCTKKRSSWCLWENICMQKFHKKLRASLGKFGQHPSHPKNLPAPTPMMKRHLRPRCPLLKGQRGKCPRHVSIFRRPCAYYSTHTLLSHCCRLQCVTAMNIHFYQRSPGTEKFITAKNIRRRVKTGE